MSASIKKEVKDESRIGEYAAKQPLSGTNIVTTMRVKGFDYTSFLRSEEEIKKAV